MKKFEMIFETLYNSVNSQHKPFYKSVHIDSMNAQVLSESTDLLAGPQEEYILQKNIRPYFGKVGINTFPIGTHPDFIDLDGKRETEKHYICTIFVDIKGSTRLSLLYPLDFVFIFKNAVIQTCVEVIRSFDGYVHRIMGDAVMAFFGGKSILKEDSVADAINCSITLRAILEESIKPWMENKGLESKDFGFRIGCDFGNDNEVLWGSFGYRNVGEVSATGLPVDMASKLQNLANKNQTMIGKGLLDFIDWPEKYSKIKTTEDEKQTKEMPFVTPNIADKNGNPINYKMRQISYKKCLEFSALPHEIRERLSGGVIKSSTQITYRCFTLEEQSRMEYISASKFLDKGIKLLFEVSAYTNNRIKFPLKVVFTKTNHGRETPEEERDLEQNSHIKYIKTRRVSQYNSSIEPIASVSLDERTLYRGLHTMKCQVFESEDKLIFQDWIGVLIK